MSEGTAEGADKEVCDRRGKTYGNGAIFIKTPLKKCMFSMKSRLKKCDKTSQFSLY